MRRPETVARNHKKRKTKIALDLLAGALERRKWFMIFHKLAPENRPPCWDCKFCCWVYCHETGYMCKSFYAYANDKKGEKYELSPRQSDETIHELIMINLEDLDELEKRIRRRQHEQEDA